MRLAGRATTAALAAAARTVGLLVALAVAMSAGAGCGPDACGYGGNQRGFRGVSAAIDRQRCAEDDRERREESRHEADTQREATGRNRARIAQVRAHPVFPEVGATVAEARIYCQRDTGIFRESATGIGCSIGSSPVFGASVSGSVLDEVYVWYEGGDLARMRDAVVARLGNWTEESVNSAGFRVFAWHSADGAYYSVQMTQTGVRTSVRHAPSE